MFRALRAFPPSAMGRTMYLRPRRSRRVTVSTARNEYVRPDHLWRAAGCDRGAQTSPAHAAGRRARIRSSPSALRGDRRAGLARDAVWTQPEPYDASVAQFYARWILMPDGDF